MPILAWFAPLILVAGQSPAPMREFLYDKAPFPECHASTILEVPGGFLAALFGGTHENNPDVGIWVLRQEKKIWSAPVEVANGLQDDGKRHPCWIELDSWVDLLAPPQVLGGESIKSPQTKVKPGPRPPDCPRGFWVR